MRWMHGQTDNLKTQCVWPRLSLVQKHKYCSISPWLQYCNILTHNIIYHLVVRRTDQLIKNQIHKLLWHSEYSQCLQILLFYIKKIWWWREIVEASIWERLQRFKRLEGKYKKPKIKKIKKKQTCFPYSHKIHVASIINGAHFSIFMDHHGWLFCCKNTLSKTH